MKKYRAIEDFTVELLDEEEYGIMTIYKGDEFELNKEEQHLAEGDIFLTGKECWITISNERLEVFFEEIVPQNKKRSG